MFRVIRRKYRVWWFGRMLRQERMIRRNVRKSFVLMEDRLNNGLVLVRCNDRKRWNAVPFDNPDDCRMTFATYADAFDWCRDNPLNKGE